MLAFQDTLDVLTKVHEFYNEAWTQLITVLGIGLGVVGVIMPVILTIRSAISERGIKDMIAEQLELSKSLTERLGEQEKNVSGLIAQLTEQIASSAALNVRIQDQEKSIGRTMDDLADAKDQASRGISKIAITLFAISVRGAKRSRDWKTVAWYSSAALSWLSDSLTEDEILTALKQFQFHLNYAIRKVDKDFGIPSEYCERSETALSDLKLKYAGNSELTTICDQIQQTLSTLHRDDSYDQVTPID